MRVAEEGWIYGLGQAETGSVVSVNAYLVTTTDPKESWKEAQPLKDAAYSIWLPELGKEVTGKTPSGGFIAVPIPLPPGTTVQVSASYGGDTQRKIVHTAKPGYPGSAMAEFHFLHPGLKPGKTAVPATTLVAVTGALLAVTVAFWYLTVRR